MKRISAGPIINGLPIMIRSDVCATIPNLDVSCEDCIIASTEKTHEPRAAFDPHA